MTSLADATPEEAALTVPTAPSPRAGTRSPRTVVLGLLVAAVGSVVCTAVLETPLWASHDQMEHPALAVLAVLDKPLDVLVVGLLLTLLWGLTGRLWLSLGVLLGLTTSLSAVNVAKMSVLHEPLYPNDHRFLRDPGFLLAMVDPTAVAAAVVGGLMLVAGTVVVSRWAARHHPRARRSDDPRRRGALIGTRVVAVGLPVVLLSSTLHFNEPGNPWRRVWDSAGATWQPWSQSMNYRTNGFVGGLLYNMPSDPMARPPGYSAATMAVVSQRWTARAALRNAGLAPGALDDVNVVLVLSEAFADLSRVSGVGLARDSMPLTRAAVSEGWGGRTLANFYGTGTSTMEFSALTGQSLGLFEPQVTAPYQDFVNRLSSYPSAVGWFAARGHATLAVHPYSPTMYRRDEVYPLLGFDRFLHEGTMVTQDRLEQSNFISDASAYAEVERALAEETQPVLANVVTMQNHFPTVGWYDDPVPVTSAADDAEAEQVAGYARGQELSDGELQDFLDRLRSTGERTVVVFYGDHYPGLFSEATLAANGDRLLETPLLIWSSWDSESRALPVTSPATFLPYVFELVGEPVPPYYALLLDVAEHVGAVGRGRVVAPDGTSVTEKDLSLEQRRLLEDYRLVQYDFSVGERYAAASMFYGADAGSAR